MSQSHSHSILHLIWSTKNRIPFLRSEIRERTFHILSGVVRQWDGEAYRVGGIEDHVHLAVRISRTISIAEMVKNVKGVSSKYLKDAGIVPRKFSWQRGYAALSIGMAQKEVLFRYIDNQEIHHKKYSFQDEYRKILKKYEIDFDERYVWD